MGRIDFKKCLNMWSGDIKKRLIDVEEQNQVNIYGESITQMGHEAEACTECLGNNQENNWLKM